MRLLILSAAVALTAAPADAGPFQNIADRIAARRGARCGQQCPAVAFKSAPTVSSAAPLVTTCYGGKCYVR